MKAVILKAVTGSRWGGCMPRTLGAEPDTPGQRCTCRAGVAQPAGLQALFGETTSP